MYIGIAEATATGSCLLLLRLTNGQRPGLCHYTSMSPWSCLLLKLSLVMLLIMYIIVNYSWFFSLGFVYAFIKPSDATFRFLAWNYRTHWQFWYSSLLLIDMFQKNLKTNYCYTCVSSLLSSVTLRWTSRFLKMKQEESMLFGVLSNRIHIKILELRLKI